MLFGRSKTETLSSAPGRASANRWESLSRTPNPNVLPPNVAGSVGAKTLEMYLRLSDLASQREAAINAVANQADAMQAAALQKAGISVPPFNKK